MSQPSKLFIHISGSSFFPSLDSLNILSVLTTEGANMGSYFFFNFYQAKAALLSSNSFNLQFFTIPKAIFPLLLLTSIEIERINSVKAISFRSAIRNNFIPSSVFSSIRSNLVRISTFPNSTSLIPER
jgi:hypothetical protein